MIFIFDLDGTLIETTELHCETFVSAFRDFGKEVPAGDIRALIGKSGPDIARELGARNPEEVFERKVEKFMARIDEVKELDGASEVLRELKSRGHKVCIATASNKRMTEAVIDRFGWEIDMVVTADDVVHSKPAPDTLNTILSRFGGEAVFVGDSKYDREMAGRAGIPPLIIGREIQSLRDILKL